MLTLALTSMLAALPVTYPDVDTSSVSAFARSVDDRLLSLSWNQTGVTLSSKRRTYAVGIFLGSEELEEVFNTSSEAAALYQAARSKLTTGFGLYVGSVVAMLAAAVVIPFAVFGTPATLITLLVVATIAVVAGAIVGVIGAFMLQDAQRQFFEAVKVYNHALLAPGYLQPEQPSGPPPMPAVQAPQPNSGLLLAVF